MATDTKLDSLVINYLTQSQYDTAKTNGKLNANQIYMTPATTYTLPTATSSVLGGVKLSDSTNSTSSASDGVAATPKAVKDAYNAVAGWVNLTLGVFDIFTMSSSISGSMAAYGRGHKIFLWIKGRDSATAGASGLINIGTVASAYRPDVNMYCAVPINMSSTGQVFGSATCEIKSTGDVNVMIGSANKVCGNSSYPWCTTSGMTIVWEYK